MSDERYRLTALMEAQMRHELAANAHKGDGWAEKPLREHEHEVVYHALKLLLAARYADAGEASARDAVREYAADVANCAAMLADSLGALELGHDPANADYDATGTPELRTLADQVLTMLDEDDPW